jgi:TolB protein
MVSARLSLCGVGVISVLLLNAPARPQTTATNQPPSNASPTVSPDGSFIAFVSNRAGNTDIFVVAAGGGAERQLTHTPDSESRPEWSRDGTRLFYSIAMKDVSFLYALELSTGQSTQLGSLPARGAVISPDGTRVAYTSGAWQASRLAVADLDGRNERVLTTTEQSGVAWNARFSPDGRRIAFTGQTPDKQLQVFVVSVEGADLRQLTRFPREQGRAQVPAWSADGRQIAFQLNRTQGVCDIWRVDAGGGTPIPVVQAVGTVLNEVPAWFPDGGRVAYQSNKSGRTEIWTVNVDGTDPRQITGASLR